MKLKILIADDVEYMRKLVQQFLLKIDNVEIVEEAGDGEEAINKAQESKPDVILLDMNMPNIGGVEVAKKIKEKMKDVRIYFFSAYDIDDFRTLVKESPVEGFIQKSSLREELLEMVQRELQIKSQE